MSAVSSSDHYVTSANLPAAFFKAARQSPDKPLLFHKAEGIWHGQNWAEISEQVCKLAAILVKQGVKAGDRVVVSAENRPEWAIADIAIMSIGAIVVPAYTTNTEEDHHYIIDHSSAHIAITSSGNLALRVGMAAMRTSNFHTLILMDKPTTLPDMGDADVLYWQDIMAETAPLDDIEDRISTLDSDDVCCFIYTSGTGGRPKGVMLTHRSIQANIDAAIELLDEGNVSENQRFLSLLPLSHSYEHTAGMHLPFQSNSEVWYCESTDQIAANLVEVSPTLMTAVPRLYEVLYERITRGVRIKGGLSAKLFDLAVKLGRKQLDGRLLMPHEFLLNRLLDKLVRKKVQARLGGNLKYFVSGGAALNPEIGSFFMALGVKLLQGYGQTEASPLISANRPQNIKIETVGPAVSGVTVKLANDGEILVAGDLLMKGYWRDEASTAAAIRNGWLHTGDLGTIDKDGMITITGRKKDIIVNSGGENIAPGRVEALLTIEPEIEQTMVDGDRRPWLSAVIVPSQDTYDMAKDPEHLKILVGDAVERANSRLSQIERVRRFVIADEKFTTENSLMTATLKVRRHMVRDLYGDRLDALYSKK
jgi:long-chain acyl-CoA synthetase